MSVSDQQKPPIGLGLGVASFGVYLVLLGFGLLPIPGGERNLHGPLWIVLCVGLVFAFAGIAASIQTFGRANAQGELPADAPTWMKAAQYVLVIAIAASFAMIGSWIAFGPGERMFGGTFNLSGGAGAFVGRAAFGVGAVICWVFLFALVIRAWRQIFARKP